MKEIKKIFLVMLLLVFALCMSSCGSGEEKKPVDTKDTVDTTVETEIQEEEKDDGTVEHIFEVADL